MFLILKSVQLISQTQTRAGHVLTFLKSFPSVLERGPSDKSFHSRSFFVVSFRYIPFRPFPFCSEKKNSHPVPFRSWRSYLKNGSIPLVPFLVKDRFHPLVPYLKKGGVQFVDF